MCAISKKQKDCVIQGNEISRSFYSCSITARKVIALAMSCIEKDDKLIDFDETTSIKTWSATFSISDFLEKFQISDCGNNYKMVREAINECQSAKITFLKENGGFISYNWFYKSRFDPTNNVIEMTFSPDVGNALYNMKLGYTVMNFKMLGKFKSIYTFRYYEIAISLMGNKGKNGNSKGQWYFEYDIESLKKTFNISSDTYSGRIDNFINYVVKNPLNELNKINTEFRIDFEKIKTGRKITGFKFTCTEYMPNSKIKILKTDSLVEKKDKNIINRENDFFNFHKSELDDIRLILEKKSVQKMPDGGFSIIVDAKTELAQRYPEEWAEIHK